MLYLKLLKLGKKGEGMIDTDRIKKIFNDVKKELNDECDFTPCQIEILKRILDHIEEAVQLIYDKVSL